MQIIEEEKGKRRIREPNAFEHVIDPSTKQNRKSHTARPNISQRPDRILLCRQHITLGCRWRPQIAPRYWLGKETAQACNDNRVPTQSTQQSKMPDLLVVCPGGLEEMFVDPPSSTFVNLSRRYSIVVLSSATLDLALAFSASKVIFNAKNVRENVREKGKVGDGGGEIVGWARFP